MKKLVLSLSLVLAFSSAGIGLRKDDTKLKDAFDKAFTELRKDVTYDKLEKKYFDFNVYGD